MWKNIKLTCQISAKTIIINRQLWHTTSKTRSVASHRAGVTFLSLGTSGIHSRRLFRRVTVETNEIARVRLHSFHMSETYYNADPSSLVDRDKFLFMFDSHHRPRPPALEQPSVPNLNTHSE